MADIAGVQGGDGSWIRRPIRSRPYVVIIHPEDIPLEPPAPPPPPPLRLIPLPTIPHAPANPLQRIRDLARDPPPPC